MTDHFICKSSYIHNNLCRLSYNCVFQCNVQTDPSSKDFQDFIVDVRFVPILHLSYRSSFVVMVTGKNTQLFSVQWTQYYQKLLDIVSLIHYRTQGMTEICFHGVDDCRYYNSINLGIRLSTVWQYLMEHLMVVMASNLTTARNCKQKKILLKY